MTTYSIMIKREFKYFGGRLFNIYIYEDFCRVQALDSIGKGFCLGYLDGVLNLPEVVLNVIGHG